MGNVIDRHSPIPYYEQLFEILKSRISEGNPSAGERLPSESEICREFELSRATVRQTLQKLEMDGWAQRIPRRGVFAAQPNESAGWFIEDTAGFLESSLSHGQTGITTEVISSGFASLPEHAAIALEVPEGTRAFFLVRVRKLNGRLAMYSTNWFPGEVGSMIAGTTDILSGTVSVSATLRNAGYNVNGARRVMRAMRAPDIIAKTLSLREGDPVLRIRSLSWDASGSKFDYYETWVVTDVVPLEVHVSASAPTTQTY